MRLNMAMFGAAILAGAIPISALCAGADADSVSPAERENAARRAIAGDPMKRRGKQFFGLDLTSAPRSRNRVELPLLFEKAPEPDGGYRLRKEVIVTRHPKEWRGGALYVVPSKRCYYIIAEPGHPGTGSQYFYGPFEGDPWKRFGIPEPRSGGRTHRFAIYLVADPVDTGKPPNTTLEELHLAPEPLITEKDLVSYDWATHTLQLKEGTGKRFPAPSVWGIPFLVMVDGNRCYLGAFWTGASSYVSKLPTISTDPWGQPAGAKDTHRIECPRFDSSGGGKGDPRGDPRIRAALEAIGRLKP